MNRRSPAADAIQDAAARVRSGELWRVGALAEKTGKTVRALHLYEEKGLLKPAKRTKGGFRLYDERALLRVQWIDRLQELGFSLTDAAEFLDDMRDESSGPAAMLALKSFYASKLAETRTAIERLQVLEGELQDSLDYLAACTGCDDHTPRHACPSCDSGAHDHGPVPDMVAAVHDPG
ncbi:MAG: MerR family transcriptional regulator [Alphaproteobacteria bacterium]|nr:MerR family transcriptional regulator [Alphaproteobacteria bacterium]